VVHALTGSGSLSVPRGRGTRRPAWRGHPLRSPHAE